MKWKPTLLLGRIYRQYWSMPECCPKWGVTTRLTNDRQAIYQVTFPFGRADLRMTNELPAPFRECIKGTVRSCPEKSSRPRCLEHSAPNSLSSLSFICRKTTAFIGSVVDIFVVCPILKLAAIGRLKAMALRLKGWQQPGYWFVNSANAWDTFENVFRQKICVSVVRLKQFSFSCIWHQ